MSEPQVDRPRGRMDGRRTLVTGGANGLGAAIARRFAAEGSVVTIADLPHQAEAAAGVIDSVVAAGGEARFEPMDVSDVAATRSAMGRAIAAMGGIDAVVASAAMGAPPNYDQPTSTMLHLSAESFDAVQQVNVRGVLVVFQEAAKAMIVANHGGAMVSLASIAAKRPTSGAYAVSKAAVWMVTRCLAQELGAHRIRVNAIGPGYVETDLFNSIVEAAAPGDPAAQERFREGRRSQVTLGRFGTPDDIANTALFLCSDEGAYFTGSILHPDGGYTSLFGGG